MKYLLSCSITLAAAGLCRADDAAQLARDAVALSNVGNYQQASAKLEEAVKLEPQNASFRLNLGLVYKSMGLYEKAAAELEQAIAADSKLAAAHSNLAFVYEAMGFHHPMLRQEYWRKAAAEWTAAAALETDPIKTEMAKKHLSRITAETK